MPRATSSKPKAFNFCNYACTFNEDGTVRYTGSKMIANKLLKGLQEQRRVGTLCDVILKVSGRQFSAHRCVLAFHSKYFQAMFTVGMTESLTREIEMHDLEASAVEILLNYMYSGSILVTKENVQDLLAAACMLQVEDLQKIGSFSLRKYLDESNCIGIFFFAEMYSLEDLKAKAREILTTRFNEVRKQEEILSLDSDTIQKIFSLNDLYLGTECEDVVLLTALQWLKHNSEKRLEQFTTVLKSVRLNLVSKNLLEDLRAMEEIKANSSLSNLVGEVMKYRNNQTTTCPIDSTAPRIPCGCIYVLGGAYETDPKGVERYDIRTSTWNQPTELPYRLKLNLALVHQGKIIYVHKEQEQEFNPETGTFSIPEIPDLTLCTYDLLLNEWQKEEVRPESPIAQLSESNDWDRAMAYDTGLGLLYVCGEKNTTRWDVKNNTFSVLPQCPDSIKGRRAIVMPGSGKLYLIGGIDSGNHMVKASGEFEYDPATNCWTEKAPMALIRNFLVLAQVDGFIYAIGGGVTSSTQKSVEKYDPSSDSWSFVSDMNEPRQFPAAVTYNNLIYAIGGLKGNFSSCVHNDPRTPHSLIVRHNTMEVYDPSADKWSLCPSMKHPRYAMAACVV